MMRPSHALVALLALSLGACSVITGKREPFSIYAPQLQLPAAAGDAQPVAWQLLVDVPVASRALDNARIMVMPTPGVLEVYPAARWRDPTPHMLRSLVIEAFDQSARIIGVSGTSAGVSADFTLAIDLRDFQIDYAQGQPQAHIRLVAKLAERSSNRIVATRELDVQHAAAGTDVAAAVAAFEQALDQLLPQLVDWSLEQGSQHWSAAEPAVPKP